MTSRYFQPSLRVPATAWFAVAAAVLGTVPAACLYAWATAPAQTFENLFYAAGLAAWLALLAYLAARLGKVRNPGWMRKASAGIAVFAWYLQWAAWMTLRDWPGSPQLDMDGMSALAAAAGLALRPDLMLATAADIVGGASSPLGGLARIVVWLIELVVLVLPAVVAGATQSLAPFCEQTGHWAKTVDVPVQFEFVQRPDEVRRKLEQDPRQVHAILIPCSDEAERFSQVTIHACRGSESFITIYNFAEMAPDDIPIREVATLSEAMPERVEVFGQLDEPVVELLRFPVDDPHALIRRWESEAARASGRSVIGA